MVGNGTHIVSLSKVFHRKHAREISEKQKKKKNRKKNEREGFFFLLVNLVQTGNTALTLMALTVIYNFLIMTALSTSQRKKEIYKVGRGDKVIFYRSN